MTHDIGLEKLILNSLARSADGVILLPGMEIYYTGAYGFDDAVGILRVAGVGKELIWFYSYTGEDGVMEIEASKCFVSEEEAKKKCAEAKAEKKCTS